MARSGYGLTRDEIFVPIDAGRLQYGPAQCTETVAPAARREVEDLAMSLHGDRYLPEQRPRTELVRVNRELKQIPKRRSGTAMFYDPPALPPGRSSCGV